MTFTRRSILRVASASLCSGVAGCGSAFRSPPESAGVRLTEITVLNRETEPHRIDVLVRDDETDEVVYWNRSDAPAATTASGSSELDSVGRTVCQDPVSEPGNYSVYADADIGTNATESNWITRELPESGCIGVDVTVTIQGELQAQVYSQYCQYII